MDSCCSFNETHAVDAHGVRHTDNRGLSCPGLLLVFQGEVWPAQHVLLLQVVRGTVHQLVKLSGQALVNYGLHSMWGLHAVAPVYTPKNI